MGGCIAYHVGTNSKHATTMGQSVIKRDKLVEFTYRISDPDGRVVEEINRPVHYIHGRRSGMHEKIERELAGRRAGDVVTVSLSPEEGFGHADPSLIITDDIKNVPEEYRRIGATVQFHNDAGEFKTFRVIAIHDGRLTFDGNHPLAGQTLTFTLKVLNVRDATPEELAEESEDSESGSEAATAPRTLN